MHAQLTVKHYILHCSLAQGQGLGSEIQTDGKQKSQADSFAKVWINNFMGVQK